MPASRFLVTGGSQGIGAAIVELARKAGHEVVFTGRNDQLIAQVAKKTGAHGLHADVSAGDENARTSKCAGAHGRDRCPRQQRRVRVQGGDRRPRCQGDPDDVRDQCLRARRHHQPGRAPDEVAAVGRHREHRVDLREEGAATATPTAPANGRSEASASAGRRSCGHMASA